MTAELEEWEPSLASWDTSDEGELEISADLELDPLDIPVQAGGESILASIEAMADPVSSAQISAQRTIVEIGKLVAHQILVHEAAGAKSELWVQLQEHILPGTEMRILREGQFLTVDFLSRSGDAVTFLTQNQVVLQEYLLQRLEGMKDIRVNVHDHSEGSFEGAMEHDSGQGRDRRREREQRPPS